MKSKQPVNMLRDEKKISCGCFFGNFSVFTNGTWYLVEVLKNLLFQWRHLKVPVNFNVKFYVKNRVSSYFSYMLYKIGEVTSKPGQTSKMNFFKKKVNSFRSLDVWMGSECNFGWRTKGVLHNLTKSYDPTNSQKRTRKHSFSWKYRNEEKPKWK